MTDFDKIDKCKNILVTRLFEPKENKLVIEVCLGQISETEEDLFISEVNLGPLKKINFDNDRSVYTIYFENYISYFVINESYDNQAVGEFSGNKIRKYQTSPYIDFCKKETLGYQLYSDKEINHFGIITSRHIINILTTSLPQIK